MKMSSVTIRQKLERKECQSRTVLMMIWKEMNMLSYKRWVKDSRQVTRSSRCLLTAITTQANLNRKKRKTMRSYSQVPMRVRPRASSQSYFPSTSRWRFNIGHP